jgi:hypothetical protein
MVLNIGVFSLVCLTGIGVVLDWKFGLGIGCLAGDIW